MVHSTADAIEACTNNLEALMNISCVCVGDAGVDASTLDSIAYGWRAG
jgi:hypothetical protein